MKSVPLNENIKSYDAVLISTNHSYISYQDLANNALLILDAAPMRNIKGKAIIVKGQHVSCSSRMGIGEKIL